MARMVVAQPGQITSSDTDSQPAQRSGAIASSTSLASAASMHAGLRPPADASRTKQALGALDEGVQRRLHAGNQFASGGHADLERDALAHRAPRVDEVDDEGMVERRVGWMVDRDHRVGDQGAGCPPVLALPVTAVLSTMYEHTTFS